MDDFDDFKAEDQNHTLSSIGNSSGRLDPSRDSVVTINLDIEVIFGAKAVIWT